MEDFSFGELLAIAKKVSINFDSLLREHGNDGLIDNDGFECSSSDLERVHLSDYNYDAISAYIKILDSIMSYRPLPF